MVSSADKDAAVNKAIAKGLGSLTSNERFAFDQAARDMTPTGRSAANVAEGKPANQHRW